VKQVYPTNQQQVIQSMAEQGIWFTVWEWLPLSISSHAKDNPLKDAQIKLQQKLNQLLTR
jgi:hypothetical protein